MDLIINQGRNLTPVEIKSASTFTSDFLRGINRFRELVGERSLGGMVLFNGAEEFNLKGTRVCNIFLQESLLQQF